MVGRFPYLLAPGGAGVTGSPCHVGYAQSPGGKQPGTYRAALAGTTGIAGGGGSGFQRQRMRGFALLPVAPAGYGSRENVLPGNRQENGLKEK